MLTHFHVVSRRAFLRIVWLTLLASLPMDACAADQFFAGDGSALNATKWGPTAAGPFTSSFTATNIANFSTVNGTGTGASINVGGISATENFTLTAVGGTISLTSTVVDVEVASGKTLNLGLQAFQASGTAGMNKKGDGVLALGATTGDMPGGFSLTSGTVVMLGANGLGNGSLTINGGTLAASASLNLNGRYSPSGNAAAINGDFTFGSSSGLALSNANLTFNCQFNLNTADHTISIGGSGTYSLGGAIALNAILPDTNLTVNGSGGGKLVLNTSSNLDGAVTVSEAKLELIGETDYATQIIVNSGGTLLLSGPSTLSKLNDAAPVTLGGSGSGEIDMTGITATHDETVGALTLNASSIIDFGTLAGGNTFRFANSSGNAWTGTLSIYNWTQGTDHLYFGTDDNSGLTASQLSQISFYTGNGTGLIGGTRFLPGGNGEVAVPEPSSLTLTLGLLALAMHRERQRLSRLRRATRRSG